MIEMELIFHGENKVPVFIELLDYIVLEIAFSAVWI